MPVVAQLTSVTNDIDSEEQVEDSPPDDATYQPSETQFQASPPFPCRNFGSDDNDLDSSTKEDEFSKSNQGIERHDSVALPHQHTVVSISEPSASDDGRVQKNSKDDQLATEQISSNYDVVPLEAEFKDESLPIQQSSPVQAHEHAATDHADEHSIDTPVDFTRFMDEDEMDALSQVSDSTAQADDYSPGHVISLPHTETREEFGIKFGYTRGKTRYPSCEARKNTRARDRARKGVLLSTLIPEKPNHRISKTLRFGRRALNFLGKHKRSICTLLVAATGAYALFASPVPMPPTTSTSQEWLLDSNSPRHVAKDSSVFSNVHNVYKTCPGTLSRWQCDFSGTIPLKFNSGKILLLHDVLYSPHADTNVVSLAQLGKAGMEGAWTPDQMTIRNMTNMELVGTALNFNNRYRLDDLAPPSRSTDYPSVPLEMLDTETAPKGASTPTGSNTTMTSYEAITTYLPFIPSGLGATTFTPTTHNATSNPLADIRNTITSPAEYTGLVLSAETGNTTAQGWSNGYLAAPKTTPVEAVSIFSGKKRLLEDDPEISNDQPRKKPAPNSYLHRTKQLLGKCEAELAKTFDLVNGWKPARWTSRRHDGTHNGTSGDGSASSMELVTYPLLTDTLIPASSTIASSIIATSATATSATAASATAASATAASATAASATAASATATSATAASATAASATAASATATSATATSATATSITTTITSSKSGPPFPSTSSPLIWCTWKSWEDH
ncbi:hypothetical protein SVAN01_07965 [Stagonosporopsis vannaccii]|nr:hypothetical protein SVAN01_07965 [Stagonosporopsis vannaccii]